MYFQSHFSHCVQNHFSNSVQYTAISPTVYSTQPFLQQGTRSFLRQRRIIFPPVFSCFDVVNVFKLKHPINISMPPPPPSIELINITKLYDCILCTMHCLIYISVSTVQWCFGAVCIYAESFFSNSTRIRIYHFSQE
jgi:hypothetical protein